MRMMQFAVVAILAGLTGAHADPVKQTCRFLDVMGGNRVGEVESMVAELAARWVPDARSAAVTQLSRLLEAGAYAGGNAYLVASMGDDLEEHLVLLRLVEGEVSGVRMRYEWTPDGLQLVAMDFKRRFEEYADTQFLRMPERIACSDGE